MIAELIEETRDRDATVIEVKKSAVTMWFDICLELTNSTILPKSQSWILGANIPGKPLSLNFYMGGYSKYKDVLQDIRSEGYREFSFNGQE